MKKLVLIGVVALVFIGGCRSCHGQESTRRSIYNSVLQDLDVISSDLETRAMNKATSLYTENVAKLVQETERARSLLREKAKNEQVDLQTYESWLSRLESDHNRKLYELGVERDFYLQRWSERYTQLKKDAKAIEALRDHEKKVKEDRCRSGVCGWFRQMFGMCGDNPHSLDVGRSVLSLGTLQSTLLP